MVASKIQRELEPLYYLITRPEPIRVKGGEWGLEMDRLERLPPLWLWTLKEASCQHGRIFLSRSTNIIEQSTASIPVYPIQLVFEVLSTKKNQLIASIAISQLFSILPSWWLAINHLTTTDVSIDVVLDTNI